MILNSNYKDTNGYFNLNKALEDGTAILISDEDARVIYLYDCINEKNFCFKYAERSGGYHGVTNKVVYESLISRMIKKFMPAVQYTPATINNEAGVICEDWDSELVTYVPVYQLISNNKTSLLYNEIFADGKICLDRILRKLSRVEDILDYKPELLELMNEEVFNNLIKIPQQFILGNLDFNVKNIAVNNETDISNKVLSFDFGFNTYCMLEQYLRGNANFKSKDIKDAYDSFFNVFYPIAFGTGFRMNIADYDEFDNLIKDFKHAVRNYPGMRKNMEEALSFSKNDLNDVILELTEKDGIKINNHFKNIVKNMYDFNIEELSKCL